jgi:3-methyladenine DNA glycosylase/8-oxoguanine DNA glycosylase
VIEQKVTGKEAFAAFRRLVLRFGAPAPGPVPEGMRVPPTADVWRHVPSWEWHRAGVDPKRSRTVCEATRLAPRLEQAVAMAPADAARRLAAVPGVGDYHLSQYVGWSLVGRPLDDDGMVELLERWRGHRYRVVRLLEVSGVRKPRFGPRMTVQDHRGH